MTHLTDTTPCPTCGGDRTRPDESHFGMCHAGWARDDLLDMNREAREDA